MLGPCGVPPVLFTVTAGQHSSIGDQPAQWGGARKPLQAMFTPRSSHLQPRSAARLLTVSIQKELTEKEKKTINKKGM
jgi:hypothetical protein